MKRIEISRVDFEVIDMAFDKALASGTASLRIRSQIECLKDQFAKAKTGYLEIEND